jgi:predicted RNA-binding Zn-ribbon protein involved in translation (DUF1610 family)
MSGLAHIDPGAAAPTTISADSLARPIADEAAPTWVCSFCGLLRVYEGGRPRGVSDRNDCRECGARLAAPPEDWTAIAQHEAGRQSVRMLIDANLF